MKSLSLIFAIVVVMWGLRAEAATLSVQPEGGSISVHEEFGINIKLDTESISANAVQATIQFPKDLLEAVRIDKTQSVFTFWLEEPVIDPSAGTIRFTTGSTSGLSGQSLQVLNVVLRMKSSGSAEISLTGSAVTAADGAGTNILYHTRGLTITTEAPSNETQGVAAQIPLIPKPEQISRTPIIASTTSAAPEVIIPFYPDPTRWYNVSAPFLVQWNLPLDVSDVAAVVNHDPAFAPTIGEGLFDDKWFPALADGLSYLHVRFKNNQGWGITNHYRFSVDTAPPVGFNVNVIEGNPSLVPNPTLSFRSGDQLSGLLHYAIRIDNKETVFTKESTHILDILPPGIHQIRVAAEDNAGNSTETTVMLEILPIPSPIVVSVNRDLFVGEGNLFISGSVDPSVTVLLTVTDTKGAMVHTLTITPDDVGEWSINIDHPLKKGTYTLTLVAVDERGAQSFPVTEQLQVRPRPLLVIFGIGISQFWFYTFTSIVMIGAIVLGILVEQYRRRRRSNRATVLERDATDLIRHMSEDINILTAKQRGSETEVVARRVQEDLKKMKDYVVENIDEISK